MTERDGNTDRKKTTFDGSRREQLRRAQTMTVRQRLEAMDELAALSERMRAMPRQMDAASTAAVMGVREQQADYRAGEAVNEIVLAGCTPTPLANYLKALGALRLLSTRHPETRGFWRNDRFVLHTSLDKQGVMDFFLNGYKPSALVTPWNGRGGFLEGDDSEDADDTSNESTRAGALMVQVFSKGSVADRFSSLKNALNSITNIDAVAQLNTARSELKRLKAVEKEKGKKSLSDDEKEAISQQDVKVRRTKGHLLQALRNGLPDDVLAWFDACLALVNDPDAKNHDGKKSVPSPLLGSGGLDGSMDFGVNYLKRLNDVFNPSTGRPRDEAKEWLGAALFGTVTDKLFSKSSQDKKKVSVGQFSPADAGGYNADNGFSGEALLNPWNTILQLEGAVLFAASTVRRLEGQGDIYASLPFTVAPTAIGDAVALADESPKGAKRRTAETWLPLWNRPTTCHELETVFQEGRITLHGRQVTNGFDCVRALASLGTSRGICSFQRFAFLKRSGDAFFALDSGRFQVRESAYSDLIDELVGYRYFLTKLHSFVRSKTNSGEWKASARLRVAAIRLDNLCVRVLRKDDQYAVLQLLELLGEIQQFIANNTVARKMVPPIPRLSEQWVVAAEDGSPEFRIAKALAGLRGVDEIALPLRAQLFPVHPKAYEWMTPESIGKRASKDAYCKVRLCIGQKGRLMDTLRALLEHRLWLVDKLEMKDKPLSGPAGATLDDVAAFLRDDRMDARIAALLPGLTLCAIPEDTDRSAGEGALPAAFGLMKLALTPDRILRDLGWLGVDERLPIPAGMLAHLAAGNHDNRAVTIAWRRLRASNLTPFFADAIPKLGDIKPTRAAAALLIPLRYGATGALARDLLEELETKADSASIA